MITAAAFVIAVICAGMMGYAIQSGATCMVYAVSELVEKRRASRLIAMLEAGLWVAATLMIAALFQMLPVKVSGYPFSLLTIAGGVLLGLGAYVNGACVFGSVGRLGSGEVGFLLTPLGYFLGIKAFDAVFGMQGVLPLAAAAAPAAPQLPLLLITAFAAYACGRAVRIVWLSWYRGRSNGASSLWDPHTATLVIGITFAVMLLGAGRWTYPELLADLARGKFGETVWRLALFAALLAGARLGGLRKGATAWIKPTRARITSCLIGGAMMGIGGSVIPGGNDGLVLVGLPFLLPYALIALLAMVTAIAAAIWMQRTLA